MKTHTCYRLTPEALAIIKRLAQEKGVSMAAIVEMAVRIMAKAEASK